jgi:HAMP domain-containing protein
MTMHPNAVAGMVAYGMADMLMSAGRTFAETRQGCIQDAWAGALASARGDAQQMSQIAVAAINRVGELEEEVARLRRALRQRTEALKAVTP